jgi:hypothetical protein
MTDDKTDLQRLADELRHQRDELKLKLHLAKADAKDEWEVIEKKWEHARGRLAVIGKEAGAASKDVREAARLVLDEIKAGYQRIRKLV